MSAHAATADTDEAPTPEKRNRFPFWAQVLAGLALGIVLGFIARAAHLGWLTTTLTTAGGIFVTLLKTSVVPLVFTAIVVSIANLRQVTNAARLALQTLIGFGVTAFIAVCIGMGLGVVTNPGQHASVDVGSASYSGGSGTWLDFLNSIVPGNVFGLEVSSQAEQAGGNIAISSSVSFNVLQLVVLGIVVGAACLAAGKQADPVINLSRSVLAITTKVVWWIIRLAPLGTLALIGKAVSSYGWGLVRPLATFTIDVYVGCAIVLFIVYPLLAKAHGLSPLKFFAGAWPAIQLGFVSRSSIGTMPVTERVVTDNLGVSRDYASFAVPFGATTKMDGCAAIYPALAAITVAQLFGIHLTITDYVLIAFVSVVGSAATAGLTGAIVMLTLTLSTLGLPLEGVGLLIAIDPILDMMRTATNVAGQALVPTLVAKRNGIIDMDVYNAASVDAIDHERAEPDAEPAREPALAG